MFKKLAGWFQRHPNVKTTAVAVGGAALTAAGNGVFGPKGLVVAGAASSLLGLFIRRPKDGGPEAEAAK
jgi:hypothetical protein